MFYLGSWFFRYEFSSKQKDKANYRNNWNVYPHKQTTNNEFLKQTAPKGALSANNETKIKEPSRRTTKA